MIGVGKLATFGVLYVRRPGSGPDIASKANIYY
jgi:hypothetical protein